MKKKIIIIIAVLTAVFTAIGTILYFNFRNKNIGSENEVKPEIMLSDDIKITDFIPYTGNYVEDGSDAEVKDIASVRIENIGEINYQYIEFTVTTDVDTYSFKASSIHKGFTLTVLEKDKKIMSNNETVKSTELTSSAKYLTEPSLLEDSIELYESHGVLNIRNYGEKEIKNIAVYYKQTDENGFFGGITYRTFLEAIKPGEIKQFNSEHFDKVVNITYEQ